MDLVIRRCGRMMDVSPDGLSPLPRQYVDLLADQLAYEKRNFVRGHQRYDPDGTRVGNVEIEHRKMYALEEGRFTTSFGFFARVYGILTQAGCRISYADLSPQPERPNRYFQNWDRVRQHIAFRHPLQEQCLRAMADNDQGQIIACPGFGKTLLAEALCHLFSEARIHIAVRPVEVAQRLYRKLSQHIPNVGLIGGGSGAVGERITVFTAASLHHSDGDCDIFLGDEAHMLLAENSAREIGRAYRYCRILLMTATPKGRSDGTDARMEMMGGPAVFVCTYQQGVDAGLVVPIRVRWLEILCQRDMVGDKKDTARERWGIWRNDERHEIVAADARANYGPEQQVLMLCAKVEHAIHMWQHLPEYSLCYGEQSDKDIAYYRRNRLLPAGFAEITPQRREMLRASFEAGTLKKVIATDVWATGVDFPSLQVLYRLDARESEIIDGQAPPRVSRIDPASGKAFGEVVDCCDRFSDYFYRKSLTRKRHYKEFEWSQDWPARPRGGI